MRNIKNASFGRGIGAYIDALGHGVVTLKCVAFKKLGKRRHRSSNIDVEPRVNHDHAKFPL